MDKSLYSCMIFMYMYVNIMNYVAHKILVPKKSLEAFVVKQIDSGG